MDRLQSMRAFVAVADEGSFVGAANRLDLSGAVVTRLVGDLERHLGTRLLQRTTRRVALTDAGEAYLGRVRHILSDVDEAHAAAQATTGAIQGTVRVLTSAVMATHVLAPALAAFRAQHAGVRLDITVDAPGAQRLEDFDLTLMGAGDSFDAAVVARPVLSSFGVLCAAPSYLEQHGTPRRPQDLVAHACMRVKVPGWRAHQWRLQREHPQADSPDPVDVTLEPAVVVNHTDTLLRATLDGAGISAHPREIVARHLRSGALRRVLPAWITGRYTLYVALPSRQFVPRRVTVFMEFLIDHVRATVGSR